MGFVTYACMICSQPIWNDEDHITPCWLNQFRASLYTDARLGEWEVPLDKRECWSSVPDELESKGKTITGRGCLVLHAACWSILEEFYWPKDVPINRLREVYESLPLPRGEHELSWRHDRGEHFTFDARKYYPWEDEVVYRCDKDFAQYGPSDDPCSPRNLSAFLTENPPPAAQQQLADDDGQYFARFPVEMRDAIASYLSTQDLLCLRQASRAFYAIFSNRPFWATRFEKDGERGYLFEARHLKSIPDWRLLFVQTKGDCIDAGLRNRRRIWKTCVALDEILRMRMSSSMQQRPIQRNDQSGSIWREVTANIRPPKDWIRPDWYCLPDGGCRLMHKQQTAIPLPLVKIAVSTMQLGNMGYITGLRLFSPTDEVALGYVVRHRETFLDVSQFAGSDLVVGPRGILAIAVHDTAKDSTQSEWIGFPKGFPVTRRLSTLESITAIEAGFDGFKMISLAMSGLEGDPDKSTSRAFQDMALWYPQIPNGAAMELNVSNWTSLGFSMTGYRPFVFSFFGGESGSYLHSLTGIEVRESTHLARFRFTFDSSDVPDEARYLKQVPWDESAETIHFPIDGANGEAIQDVEYQLKRSDDEKAVDFYRNGVLCGLRITTNKRRILSIPEDLPVEKLEKFHVREGTTITGFYQCSSWEYGTGGFGIISEDLSGARRHT